MTDNNTETNNQDPRDLTHEEVLRELVLARRAIKKLQKELWKAEDYGAEESNEKDKFIKCADETGKRLREEEKRREKVEKRLAAIMRAMKPIIAPEIAESALRAEKAEEATKKAEDKLSEFENKIKGLVSINNG